MVKLNKIYTRTGDDGTTGLGTGDRVKKYNLRIEAYGTVDETNAVVGLARHFLQSEPENKDIDSLLATIQNDLFDLGADLCVPDTGKDLGYQPLRISENQVTRIEEEIDRLNSELSPLNSFILPGGSGSAAALHMARTVSRRAERIIVELAEDKNENVSDTAIKYINRLSDLFFVCCRFVNKKGEQDILWEPGKNN